MSTTLDLGHFPQGSAPTFTFVFKRTRLAADPAVAPVLNVTVGGVKTDESSTLTHPATGTYAWTPLLTVVGLHTGTIYAPAGTGQTAQSFVFVVDKDENYP